MSNRNAILMSRSMYVTLVVCGSLCFGTAASFGQGFSIFEPPTEDKAPVVSPQEAFTNPKVELPKSQFGSFGRSDLKNAPKLKGSKAVGTYAHDGPGMFKQAPNATSGEEGKLKPFVANSLRPQERPQPDSSPIKEVVPPPVVVGDFQKSARRLPARPEVSALPKSDGPKVAQVAFQDGGFKPQSSSSLGGEADRFSQGANRNRFNLGARKAQSQGTTPQESGLGQPTVQQRPSLSQQNKTLQQRSALQQRTPLQPQTRQGLQPSRESASNPVANSQQSGFGGGASGIRTQPTRRQEMRSQPMGMRQQNPVRNERTPRVALQKDVNRRASASPANAKAKPKSAKELLTQWATVDADKKTPGKKMKLHEFLASPINGSRKDAINQYWVTYVDMARNRLAVEHAQWLGAIESPRQQAEQAILKVAQQQAQNRVMQSEIQLAKSQLILGDYLPNLRSRNGQVIPILPSNTPWVGKMNTRLKEYQRRGIVPPQFSGIDDYLVKAKQLISNEAESVVAAGKAAEQARSAMRSGQTSIANVLEVMRIKERNEEEFLAAVLGYNRAITDYVLSVRQDIYQPKRLASVLIGSKATQPTLAKVEKPTEDVDPETKLPAEPRMKQVSSPRQAKTQNRLPGKSAYQEQEADTPESNQPSSILNASSNETAKAKSAGKPFEYGPTSESAAASNFDPNELKEELPMQQTKPSVASDYQGNGQQARSAPTRRASGNAGLNSSRQFGSQNTSRQPGISGQALQPRGIGQGQPRNVVGAPQAGQRRSLGDTGAFPKKQPLAPAADSAPKIPASSPFTDSTAARPTTGASIQSQLNLPGSGPLGGGGGTFNSSNPAKPASTASGFGTPGFSSRR